MRLKRTVLTGIVYMSLFQFTGAVVARDLPEVESLSQQSPWQAAESRETYVPDDATETESYQADALQADMSGGSAAHNPMVSLFQKISALQEEMQELRGKLEEQGHQMHTLKQSQRDYYLDLDKRLRAEGPQKIGGVSTLSLAERQALENSDMTGILDTQIASQNNSVATIESASTLEEQDAMDGASFSTAPTALDSASEEKVYNQAYQFIQNKDYESALTAFKSMIKSFPDGKYKPNGHYWMGEIYMVQGELDLAANEFNTVYQMYPKSPKAADALLKLGYVEYAKGQWERSKELLSKVQTQFPGSASARLASTRLQRMQQERRL